MNALSAKCLLRYFILFSAAAFSGSLPLVAQLTVTTSTISPSAFLSFSPSSEASFSGIGNPVSGAANTYSAGQSFTSPGDYLMDAISIRYYTGNSPLSLVGTTLQLDIFEMASAADTNPGNSLYSAQGTWPSFSIASNNSYITFTFPSISISNGSVYGFMVSQITDVDALFGPGSHQTSDGYAGGRALSEINGSTQVLNAQYDMVFRVSGAAIPEPSTYTAIVGLLTGCSTLWYRRQRRIAG